MRAWIRTVFYCPLPITSQRTDKSHLPNFRRRKLERNVYVLGVRS